MTDKVQKIREEVERLKSQLLRGACSSQVAMETRCKEEAYNEVLGILDIMQEEPAPKILEDILNAKPPAESLGISQEEYEEIIDKCLFDAEPEIVDTEDLPLEEPVSKDLDLGCGVIWKGEEPISEDLEKEARNYGDELDNVLSVCGDDDDNSIGEYVAQAYIAGAQCKEEQMMKDAISCEVEWYDGKYLNFTQETLDKVLSNKGIEVGDKVKVIIIKED